MATKKTRKKKTSNNTRHWFLRYHVIFWLAVVSVTLLALVIVLRLPLDRDSGKVSGIREQKHKIVSRPESVVRPLARSSVSRAQVYEEQEDSLENRAKEADLAIIQTLVLKGYDPAGIKHGAVDIRMYHGREYHFQRLELAVPKDKGGFVVALQRNLNQLVEGGSLIAQKGDNVLTVKILGVPTHEITFSAGLLKPSDKAMTPVRGKKCMVIVVDDLGRSVRAGNRLAALAFPVTFSVMPCAPRSSKVAAIARNAGRELILHLPMEPASYPKTNPGPGALFVGMCPAQIKETLQEDLALVPGASGANNHMGSRFTQDRQGMGVVIGFLRKRGLFFLDSMTTRKSCVREVAARNGMPYLRRNIFLDNVRDEKAILFQLRKAESLARKHGYAIAIGHPYPETLHALESWQRMRDPAVAQVKLKDILRGGRLALFQTGR